VLKLINKNEFTHVRGGSGPTHELCQCRKVETVSF